MQKIRTISGMGSWKYLIKNKNIQYVYEPLT